MDMNFIFIIYDFKRHSSSSLASKAHHFRLKFCYISAYAIRNRLVVLWIWLKNRAATSAASINLVEFWKEKIKRKPAYAICMYIFGVIAKHRSSCLGDSGISINRKLIIIFTILISCFFSFHFLSFQIAIDFIGKGKPTAFDSAIHSISITMAVDGQWRQPIWY